MGTIPGKTHMKARSRGPKKQPSRTELKPRPVPVRLLHRQVLPLFLAADRQPANLGRLRLDSLVSGPWPDARLRRQGAVVFAGQDPVQVPEHRQSLPDLLQSSQDLPRIHDRRMRIRRRLVVRQGCSKPPSRSGNMPRRCCRPAATARPGLCPLGCRSWLALAKRRIVAIDDDQKGG